MRDNLDLMMLFIYLLLMMPMMIIMPESALETFGFTPGLWFLFLIIYVCCLPFLVGYGLNLPFLVKLFRDEWHRDEWSETFIRWHINSCLFLIAVCVLLRILSWCGVF